MPTPPFKLFAPEAEATAGRTSYRKAYVTFLDILGFREVVTTSTPEEIARIIRATRRFSADENGEQTEAGLSTVAFSDSVVRIRNATETSGLFFELLDLIHAQGELAALGILVRGGLAYGDIHHDGDRLFGPALVQAYDLESKFAVYPRIVIDPCVLKALCKGELPIHNELTWEIGHIMELLRHGDDGVYFIDYLRAFIQELDDPPIQAADLLRRHRQAVLKLGKAVRRAGGGLSSLALKANWLATYHNSVVTDLASPSGRAKLKVTTSNLPSFFIPPRHTKPDGSSS